MPLEPLARQGAVPSPRRRLLPSSQTALLALITEESPHAFTPPAEALVISDGRASAEERIHIYAHMYRARIAEALESQFPRLAKLLGPDVFADLAFAYVTDHPSRHPSLRFVGAHLPDWLEDRQGSASLADLARLEWARSDVFDAADEPLLTIDALRGWPTDAFMQLPLKLVAAHRFITVDFAIADFWERIGGQAASAEVAGPAVPEGAAGESLLIWRQDANVCHRVLAESERQVLELVAAGTSFGVVCDTLPSWRPTEEASAQAFGWLWSWATADLLVAPSGDLLLPGAAG